jgi:hypothetical protein
MEHASVNLSCLVRDAVTSTSYAFASGYVSSSSPSTIKGSAVVNLAGADPVLEMFCTEIYSATFQTWTMTGASVHAVTVAT